MEGRALLLSGVDKLAETVRVTLGPRGRTVVMYDRMGKLVITKDGVSAAKEITFEVWHSVAYRTCGAGLRFNR